MEKRTQPPWTPPEGTPQPKLRLFNSLTRQEEIFVPQNGNKVSWYSCGPTVYDASHMGHARSYISFDILRRILTNYFKYDVQYVMNITDIDDKIIKRARQKHLLQQYIDSNHSLDRIVQDVQKALAVFKEKLAGTTDPDKKQMFERIISKVSAQLANVESSKQENTDLGEVKQKLVEESADLLSDRLDAEHGSTVTDNSIFADLPRYWEDEFNKDMEALNVLSANIVTRVSEYVPQIVEYTQKIIANGLAYESNGSVYFDVPKFDKEPNHHYAKLLPEAVGDCSALNEGEGDLCVSEDRLKEKKSPNDFALWKASKPGEPSWDSPWGKGRPGWHIECSVMASAILGESIDIHTGGVDLKFPHHDNELAQAEAYYGNDCWVRYFLHSGHLTISGCKMSKSLKNFITIKEALRNYSARQLRLAFLLHSWKDTLDYSSNTMEMATKYEKTVNEFFLNVADIVRNRPKGGDTWTPDDTVLNETFFNAKAAVHQKLCDNINTRGALDVIRDLITNANSYVSGKKSQLPNAQLLRDIAAYITELFDVFGLIGTERIGFASGGQSKEDETVIEVLAATAEFRDKIRGIAKASQNVDILKLCDELRDDVLPNLGIRLEDREGQPTVLKIVGKEEMRKEREQKKQQEETKRLEKELKKKQQAEAQAEKDAKKRIPPSQMFRDQTDKYSLFDQQGMPTHDNEGKELSKGQLKKLAKLYQAQEKVYQSFVATANGDA